MKIASMFLAVAAFLAASPFDAARACTAFEILDQQHPVMAYSFDWTQIFGYVVKNVRGETKSALIYEHGRAGKPYVWTSKYGSVSVNVIGRNFPQTGMNERGLSVASLLNDTDSFSEAANSKPYINERQWIQVLLDSAGSLDEAVRVSESLEIDRLAFPNHLFVCDASAKCGVFEHINHHLVIVQGADLVVPVITNFRYRNSLETLQQPIPADPAADSRFARTAVLLAKYAGRKDSEASAFEILNQVPYPDLKNYQHWHMVYDPKNLRVIFRTQLATGVKEIRFSDLDFSANAPRQMLDVNARESGHLQLLPYNQGLIDVNTDRTDLLSQVAKGSIVRELIKRVSKSMAKPAI